jgi:hypothetical protein
MTSVWVAAFIAGLALAATFGVYFLLRGKAFVTALQAADTSMASSSPKTLFWSFLGAFILAAFLLAFIAGFVYSKIGAPLPFLGLAFGLALAASILAVVSKTPLIPDKVGANFMVAGVLGVLIPFLAA